MSVPKTTKRQSPGKGTPKAPTPAQRAILEQLAAPPPDGGHWVAEVEVDGNGRESAPALAVKRSRSEYIEQRPLAIATFRVLRARDWIAESARAVIGEETHGPHPWRSEHVEYRITPAGRAALIPKRQAKRSPHNRTNP